MRTGLPQRLSPLVSPPKAMNRATVGRGGTEGGVGGLSGSRSLMGSTLYVGAPRGGISPPLCKGKVWRVIRKHSMAVVSPSDSHYGHSARPLLWPFPRTRRRFRHRDDKQRRRVCAVTAWRSATNQTRHKASDSSSLWSQEQMVTSEG